MSRKFVEKEKYLTIIENTQLVSVDLIIRYFDSKIKEYKYFLGLRKNKPAYNTWFIPGSRLYKDVTIKEGVKFVAENEYGLSLENKKVEFVGIYEHIYPNNFDNDDFGTHYIDFSYLVTIDYDEIKNLSIEKLEEQHKKLGWFTKKDILNKKFNIHSYTLNYFSENKINQVIDQQIILE